MFDFCHVFAKMPRGLSLTKLLKLRVSRLIPYNRASIYILSLAVVTMKSVGKEEISRHSMLTFPHLSETTTPL